MDSKTAETGAPPIIRRRSPKGEKRRELILDATLAELSAKGYINASIGDIAKRAGISAAGVLHHFPSKEALLDALLQRQDEQLGEHFIALRENLTLDTLFAYLRRMMQSAQETYGLTLAKTLLNCETLSPAHPAWQRFQDRYDFVHASADEEFRILKEKGEIRPDIDIKQVHTELFALLDGLQIQWLRRPERVDMVKSLDNYLARLEAFLRPA